MAYLPTSARTHYIPTQSQVARLFHQIMAISELRNMIVPKVTGISFKGKVYPNQYKTPNAFEETLDPDVTHLAPELSLLRAEPALGSRIASETYRWSLFSFDTPQTLLYTVDKQLTTASATIIRRIELAFSHDDFIHQFLPTIDYKRLQYFEPRFTDFDRAPLLKDRPLELLVIRLPDARNLWGNMMQHRACHSVICKWIIKAVHQSMSHIEHIRFENLTSGDPHQLAEIERLADARVISESYEDLSDGTMTWPPKCFCEPACKTVLH